MKDTSTPSQIVRALFATAGLAVALVGCGSGGASTTSCDTKKIFSTCGTVGCHNAANPAANFDMTSTGWEMALVGHAPVGGGPPNSVSLCFNMNHNYLDANSSPATGLFLDKLSKNPPGCGAVMPNIGPRLTAAEMACVQTWANDLVAAAK
jgi:hypothetical protein